MSAMQQQSPPGSGFLPSLMAGYPGMGGSEQAWRNGMLESSRLAPLQNFPQTSASEQSSSMSNGKDRQSLPRPAREESRPSNGGPSVDRRTSLPSSSTTTAPPTAKAKHLDSDTEDAAMVLEGLAMSGQERNACGQDVKCEPRSMSDPVAREPSASLVDYVTRNKATDIMLDISQGGTSGAVAGDQAGRVIETQSSCGYGGPQSLEEVEKLEASGVDVSPAKKVCLLLKDSPSLFRPIYGPESFLGFGMGWVWPAAEAAKDLHVKGSECPGSAQREAVIRAIIRTLPRRQLMAQLVSVFADRVNFLTGNIVHMPSFRRDVEAFYALETVERQARAVNNVDVGWLAVLLLTITLALRFYPCNPPQDWDSVSHLFDGRSIHLYASAARTALVLARYQSSQSLSVLQAILLSHLSDSHAGYKVNETMLRIGITNAQSMGLHRLGDAGSEPRAGEATSVAIRRELAKRIWYQLLFKDWSYSSCSSGVYNIQESQFNTPLPSNYNDEDLEQTPLPPPRPREEHSDMSYSLESIKVVKVMKMQTDMKNAQRKELDEQRASTGETARPTAKRTCQDAAVLDAAYREILDKLPVHFSVGSDCGTDTNIEIQRWLIQQVVFHQLLKLHRPALSSKPNARTSCVALARSILDTQKKLRGRCTVVDRLLCNLTQSYTAAIVLLLDLLQNGSAQPPGMRLVIRSEVAEALRALNHVNETTNSVEAGIRVIEALLAEEEARWVARQSEANSNGSQRTSSTAKPKDMLNLALRISQAVKGDEPVVDTLAASASDAATNNNGSSSFDWPTTTGGAESNKDALSRALMEQLLIPDMSSYQNEGSRATRPGDNAGPSFAGSTSNPHTGPTAHDSLLSYNGIFNSSSSAPNGVEATLPSPNDGPTFDLSSFLAQYASPGSNSNGSGSSSAGDSSSNSNGFPSDATSLTSGSAGSMDHDGSHYHSGKKHQQNFFVESPVAFSRPSGEGNSNGTTSQPGQSPTDHTQTGLDAFYSFLLSQGVSSGVPAVPTAPVAAASGTPTKQKQQYDDLKGAPSRTGAAPQTPTQYPTSGPAMASTPSNFGQQQGFFGQYLQSGLPFLPPFGGPPQNSWGQESSLSTGVDGGSVPTSAFPLNVGTPSAGIGSAFGGQDWLMGPPTFFDP